MDKILFVDDEKFLLSAVKRILSNHYEVIGVTSGAEGLKAVTEQEFVLVLSDIRMPEMSGVEMVNRLRANGCTLPIIYLSADTGEHENTVQYQLTRKIVQGFVHKPFQREELLMAIGNALQAMSSNEA